MALAPRARLLLLLWEDERPRKRGTFRFQVGCCCHDEPPDPCIIVEDHFNRPDNTDLNAGVVDGAWVENTGNPAITSNVLRFTTADARATNTDVSYALGSCARPNHVRVKVRASTSGNKARVYFGDAGFELEFGAGKIRAFDESTAVSSYLAECAHTLGTNAFYDVEAYRIDNGPALSQGSSMHLKVNDVQVMSSPIDQMIGSAGLGTGDTLSGNVEFDDFVLSCIDGNCEQPRHYCWPFRREAPLEILATVNSMPTTGHTGCRVNPIGCQELAGDTFRLVMRESVRTGIVHHAMVEIHLSYELLVATGYHCVDDWYDITATYVNLDVGVMADGGCRVYLWVSQDNTGFFEPLAAWDIRNVPTVGDSTAIDNLCGDFPVTLSGVAGYCNVTDPLSTVTLALP